MEPPEQKSSWGRWGKPVLIGCGAILLICAVLVGALLIWTSDPVMRARQAQIAPGALQNPGGAPLKLGHYGDVNGWHSAGLTDYAVQDGMVIFPAEQSGYQALISNIGLDVKRPVIVYAPNAGDLSTREGPTTDRTYFMGNEWYVYDCIAIDGQPSWWRCSLIVGANI
jgi:hypothetical protein